MNIEEAGPTKRVPRSFLEIEPSWHSHFKWSNLSDFCLEGIQSKLNKTVLSGQIRQILTKPAGKKSPKVSCLEQQEQLQQQQQQPPPPPQPQPQQQQQQQQEPPPPPPPPTRPRKRRTMMDDRPTTNHERRTTTGIKLVLGCLC